MTVMSIREFNASVSRTLARVEAGETIEIARNGKIIVEMKPKNLRRSDDPAWQEAHKNLLALLSKGVRLGGPASYDERTG